MANSVVRKETRAYICGDVSVANQLFETRWPRTVLDTITDLRFSLGDREFCLTAGYVDGCIANDLVTTAPSRLYLRRR